MHRRFRFPGLLMLLAGALLLSLPAAADEEETDAIPEGGGDAEVEVLLGSDADDWNEPDWIPSLSVGVGFYSQKIETHVLDAGLGSLVVAPANLPIPLRGGEDDNAIDGAAIALAFELMGPEVEILPGDPRFLIQAGFREGLFPTRSVGRARTTFDPCDPQTEGQACVQQINSQLQGDTQANTEVHLRDYSYAGLGMSFQLPIDGMNIKLKPSLSWVRSEATFTVRTAEPSGTGGGALNRLEGGVRGEWIHHGISPRLVLDAEVLREGPISVGFFAEVETMVFFGEHHDQYCVATGSDQIGSPRGQVRGSVGPCPPDPGGTLTYSQVDWDIQRKRISVYGGVGIRVSWMGFD